MRSSKQTHAKGHRAKQKFADNSRELQQYYTQVYGSRWPALQQALLKPTIHAAVANSFVEGAADACTASGLSPLLSIGALTVFRRLAKPSSKSTNSSSSSSSSATSSGPYEPPPLDPSCALRTWYWMDLASLLPVLLLQPRKGHATLDMCAAPGGKSTLVAQHIFSHSASSLPPPLVAAPSSSAAGTGQEGTGPGSAGSSGGAGDAVAAAGYAAGASPLPLGPGKLSCNEPDRGRLQRLNRVLEEYLPTTARMNVEVYNYQGHMYWARNQGSSYDRVLVDAPCSSDRHVLQNAASVNRGAISAAEWSLAGCKRIADAQLQLCLSALRALRVGGRLSYSTCSISPLQNDNVIDRLLERCGAAVRVLPAMDILQQEAAAAAAANVRSVQRQAVAGGAEGWAEGGADGREEGSKGTGMEAAKALVDVFGAEATKHGLICLPDRKGWGPIYVAVVEKVGEVPAVGPGGGLVAGMAALLREVDEEEEDEEEGEEVEHEANGGAGTAVDGGEEAR